MAASAQETPRDRLRRQAAGGRATPADTRGGAASLPAGSTVTQPPIEVEVETLLADMRASQERLLDAVRAHREAISRADERAIQAGLEQHRRAIDQVRQIEERRVRLGVRVGGRGPGARVTFGEILGRVPATSRERLTSLAAGVKEVAIVAQREQRALGEASLALAGHMQGLMRGVSARVSEAGTYGRRGYVEGAGRAVGTLDVSR